MDTARHLCANGVQGGGFKTDHGSPSPNRTPPIYRFLILHGSNYTREGTIPKQSVDWSFIDPLIYLRKGRLTLHARLHGWLGFRNVM